VNLILFEAGEIGPEGLARVTGERARHLSTVLQAAPGSRIRVGLVDGPTGTATVLTIGEAGAQLQCLFDGDTPAVPGVDILLALPRPKVLRRLWSQLAALGVGRIILTNASRVERSYFDTHVLTPECYRPLLLEGLQQARDTRVPVVSIHKRFRVLVEDDLDRLTSAGVRLVAQPRETRSIGEALAHVGERRVLLAIGPEGGWNEFELQLMASHGFTAIGMGGRTLRSDTASIALLALVHDALATPAHPRTTAPTASR
jgi:RsmE family RNA methyltransferase